MTIQKGEPIANPGIRAQQRLQLRGMGFRVIRTVIRIEWGVPVTATVPAAMHGKRGDPLRQSGLFPDGAWGAASASSGWPRASLGIRGTDAKRIAFPRKTPRASSTSLYCASSAISSRPACHTARQKPRRRLRFQRK